MAEPSARSQAGEDGRDEVAPGDWMLDPKASSVGFRALGFWGLTPVKGQFTQVRGTLSVDADGSASISLQVEATSVATGIGMRDGHLRGHDFLDAEAHPTITFASDRTRWTDTGIDTGGRLTVRGQPLELDVPLELRRDGADLRAVARCTVDLRAFGMHRPLGMVRPQADLTIDARLVRDVE